MSHDDIDGRGGRELDERLNAFVDGELSAAESAALGARLRREPALAERVRRLRVLKAAVGRAYRHAPGPLPAAPLPAAPLPAAPLPAAPLPAAPLPAAPLPAASRPPRARARCWLTAAAALALVLAGGLAGWSLQQGAPARLALIDPDGTALSSEPAHRDELRVVFHVNGADRGIAAELLDDIEWMLNDYRRHQRPLRVEVIAHGDGLWLLRDGLSGQEQRIRRLAERYPTLTFVACQNTVDQLRKEQGAEISLIPEAQISPSGVAQVVRRLQAGWLYIQV